MDTVRSASAPEDAARFDRVMAKLERRFFPDARSWVCSRAQGETLEIAIGTGLNLPHYPAEVALTGIDRDAGMLVLAADRARRSGRGLATQVADALQLPFHAASFDTVVCTFALCEVTAVTPALCEFARVLRPHGTLLLADHVVATHRGVRLGQRLLEALTIPLSGEHFTRRPLNHLAEAGLEPVEVLRRAHGAVEYVAARNSAERR